MKRSNMQKSISRRQTDRSKNESLSHPPQLDGVNLRHSMRVRFTTSAALSQANITVANLLDTYLVATTATAVSDVFQTVKVRQVEMWALPTIGAATTVSCEFGGTTVGILGDQIIHSDTSMGIQPAHVLARPSKRSLISDYQIRGGNTAFFLTCPAGTVIDVSLSFVGQFAVGAAATNAAVGATAGAFYLRGLDGLATATSQIPPELAAFQI